MSQQAESIDARGRHRVLAELKRLEQETRFVEDFPKVGLSIATKGLDNEKLMTELFAGTTATGVGGCFSPTMALGTSYLSKNAADHVVNVESEQEEEDEEKDEYDEGVGEGSGDNYGGVSADIDLNVSSAALSVSPPKTVRKKVNGATSSKRKSEESFDDSEQKRRQASLDNVIQLLEKSAATYSSARDAKVVETLSRMEVLETRGSKYFIRAIKYLENEAVASMFLALREDHHKWMYLEETLPLESNDI